MRLFVAIQLSDDMKKSIIQVMHDLKGKGVKGNYSPLANLHLTLCFIGETLERKKIEEALSTVTFKPFKLSTSDMGNFGDLIWLGTRSGQALNTLVADIRKAFDNAGIEYDAKPFKPHITLIRKSSGVKPFQVPKSEMMVKKVSLMKSERKDGKMVYTEIASIKSK